MVQVVNYSPTASRRTDNDVKNYWNTKLRKKLTEMGIDPVTHKPFSQILADYGNIGGLPKSGTRIRCLNRDMSKNAFMMQNLNSMSLHFRFFKHQQSFDDNGITKRGAN